MSLFGHKNRREIDREQLGRLRELLAALAPLNRFYAPILQKAGLDGRVGSVRKFIEKMPFTDKARIVEDQRAFPPYGSNLTFELEQYTRFHQTSGTTGEPIRWLDTAESWRWMLQSWKRVYEAAGLKAADRVYFAFSFGPFLGFWTAFEAAADLGCMTIAGGGLSSGARLRDILANQVTAICCTPTYAVRLCEVAREEEWNLEQSTVRAVIVAGEPGGSIPAMRKRIERGWGGARVFDHYGLTETGPVAYECPAEPGILHIMEDGFIAEVVEPATGRPVDAGATGELVLTNLGRIGSPLLRYRTGDLVKPRDRRKCICGTWEMALEGGVLGRTDDMVVVRGVNVYPSAMEQVLRQHPEVADYRVKVSEDRSMTEMNVELEPAEDCADVKGLCRRVSASLRTALSLRVPVTAVEPGALPRFEMKARRWVRTRQEGKP